MSKIKPSIPRGTRDFGPQELYKRNYIFNIIRTVFEKYGYEPIETPTMENLSTLTGKYGEEGDQLLYRVLNSGNFISGLYDAEAEPGSKFKKKPSPEISDEEYVDILLGDPKGPIREIAEKGLRYDLTIPFARFVVMHQNDITFPFKRYQIQPVWRADRPQKGRYREFYQCDVDVVGSNSLLNEVELVQIYDEVFQSLKIPGIEIKLNNRKILAGIAEVAGISEQLTSFTVAIDKLDKIGVDGVKKELEERGIDTKALKVLEDTAELDNTQKLAYLQKHFAASEIGLKGVEEMRVIFKSLESMDLVETKVAIDITLARGLNYYTGTIFEVKATSVEMGSIGGGGRYDNLTGMFGLPGISGVGISFGAERIYDVMEELQLFPANTTSSLKALFINFDGESEAEAFKALQVVRKAGIKSELYPSPDKIKKQMSYADKKHVEYVIFIGEEEIQQGKVKAKNLVTGEENLLNLTQLITLLSQE